QVGQVSSTFMNTLLIADGQIDASYNFLQPLQKMTTDIFIPNLDGNDFDGAICHLILPPMLVDRHSDQVPVGLDDLF
ncbi:MAG: hypothetical protein QNJ46_26705, partial [Leptolyngbyaceae cyanobacterium MO_188.B28]|nr:hypothetical protein [Leptolyngbyaceae cyanobacterium MO_188.B28]